MLETDAELAELDALFQAHMARANPHMKASSSQSGGSTRAR